MNTNKFDILKVKFTDDTEVEYRNGEIAFVEDVMSIWGDIYDSAVTSPVHHTYKREDYEKVEVF